MWKKNSILKENSYLLIFCICNLLIDMAIGYLYNITREYIIYIVVFNLIIWGLLIGITLNKNKKLVEKYNNESNKLLLESEKKDLEKYWKIIREKEDFFTLWAHQIKTPISALRALFDTSKESSLDYKNQLFKIESYVEMALNYIRFDSMSSDLVIENKKIDTIVKEIIKKYAPVFIQKHLSIKLENLDISVLTDEKWFSFVLEQIISNALKYTNEGGITITGKINEEFVAINIIDTGIGIRTEDIPRVFEKGFTGFNGRLDKKASGIGLYLCNGICEKLGHELKLYSEVGKGSTFSIICKKDLLKKSNLTKM
ncbi:hypothetical protein SAMN05216249_10910 [Acetitomaculum ruminis DSM 5522]|uniref:histidine kinase n=1 Tax=Acetitomaculum ruminis DSM 5522 TaxID=1120918 RepID=A0A1I0Y902_9FIRM|nr:sensor histidine kinase [Acetitomaculum ruminis]SFB09277.1 hypothetical protein SAMN05216249_10910 [Acetitomaculum ruminis DSM 5522]